MCRGVCVKRNESMKPMNKILFHLKLRWGKEQVRNF
jgi:hypothetical protein